MLEFRTISIEDREWISLALRASDYRGCEYSFANNMAWRRQNDSRIARFQDYYLCCAFDTADGVPSFIWPSGTGDADALLDAMIGYVRGIGKPLQFWNLSEERTEWLRERLPGLEVRENRESWDYLYLAEDLATLAGRKYHQKRNFLHRFSEYGAEVLPMTHADFDDCITFAAMFYNDRLDGDADAIAEQFAIDTFFRHFDVLGLQGEVIRKDGQLVAFAIGEPLNSDTFCVHIEKADTAFQGAYAAINQAFAQRIHAQGFRYINREEDMGLPGLRKAKESYHPAAMVQKLAVRAEV